MFLSESRIDSEPMKNLNSDNNEQNGKQEHFYTDQEIESLFSTDFFLKIDQETRKAKDDFVEKVKDDLIEYLTSKAPIQKNEIDDISAPSITQETSNNYFSHQEEEDQLIEEEEEVSFTNNDLQSDKISSINKVEVSTNSNDLQSDIVSNINEEENQNEFHEQSDKMPSEIFHSFVDEEEEDRSKFEFENFSQIPKDLASDELSQIEKVKHYGSVASDSQIGGEEELHSVNFLSNNNDDINLSPISDNKSGDNNPTEVSSASHISGDNGFGEFGSDAILNEFGN